MSRVRKIRCDEQKPECNRCLSTGRQCDGYAPRDRKGLPSQNSLCTSSESFLPKQLRVALPKKNDQELRSYRYFLEVTAPAIAGAFEVDFWLTYIPRACHLDTVIWHAVVSLGAVHEASINNRDNTVHNGSTFALQQFNTAIDHLVRPRVSGSLQEVKWRALTASVVFTYLCSYQGLHSEAQVHLHAAKNLIHELQEIKEKHNGPTSPNTPKRQEADLAPSPLNDAPVPYDDLFSVVACLEITARLLDSGGSGGESEPWSDASAYITWRTYCAPAIAASSKICKHGRCFPTRATAASLSHAGRGIKSLLNGLMRLSQRDAGDMARLLLQAEPRVLASLVRQQQPYIRAYQELGTAIDAFVTDTYAECTCFGSRVTPSPSQKKAVTVLRMYHATCYPLFLDSPTSYMLSIDTQQPQLAAGQNSTNTMVDQRHHRLFCDQDNSNPPYAQVADTIPSSQDPAEALAMHFDQALILAESILQDPASRIRPDSSSDFIPTLPTITPLLIMAHVSGITTELRRRVIDLLRRYPQREVFLESTFVAALCELILSLEASDRHGTLEIEGATPQTALSNKVYGAGVTFTSKNRARVAIQMWDEWLAGQPAREEVLMW